MRQLIRRRGDTKGGSYIDQAGREVEAAAARKRRQPCICCGHPVTPEIAGDGITRIALCGRCVDAAVRAAEEEIRNG